MPRVKPEAPREERSDPPAPRDTAPHRAGTSLWEQFLSRENLALALRRVERNAGAAGIDGMSTEELRPWLKQHWPAVRARLEYDDGGFAGASRGVRVKVSVDGGQERPESITL